MQASMKASSKQYLCTDLRLACTLAYAGYRLLRTIDDPLGKTYVFEDPRDTENSGGIAGIVEQYEHGILAISDARGLLELFQEQLAAQKPQRPTQPQSQIQPQIQPPANVGEYELLRATEHIVDPERTWTTHSVSDAMMLKAAGYELLKVEQVNGKSSFRFAYDDGIKPLISKLNNRLLVAELQEIFQASIDIKNAMRDGKRYSAGISTGISGVDVEQRF